VVTTHSRHDHAETVERLLAAIDKRALKLFALIDHAGAAREVGLELADEQVVIFGSPKAGTGLMQEDPQVGIELPMRILVWRKGDDVRLGYKDPQQLAQEYKLAQHGAVLDAMSKLLGELVEEAAD
jgi:beta-galactosidase